MENPKILIKIHVNDPAFFQEGIEEVKELAIKFTESLGICAQLTITIPKTEQSKSTR